MSSRWRSIWFGRSPRTRSNDSIATGTRSGCATHVPSKPWEASRSLSSRTFSSASCVDFGVAARRDERRHPAHRVGTAAVARLHEELAVRPHEGHRHRHRGAIGEHELGPVPELLDDAEDVVPPTGVEPGGVIAQLVEDLVHLERRKDRLDEDGRLDRPVGHAEPVLREGEHVVPEARLDVRLELREVEVPPVPPVVAEEVEPEVEQRAGHRCAVDCEVALLEMPAARSDEQHGDLVVQRVLLLTGVERDRPLERVSEVPLTLDAVLPGRRVRVLEVGHEDPRPRVEGVDDHLAVDRARDLDAPVGDLLGGRGDPPVAGPHAGGRREEVGKLAACEPFEPLRTTREDLAPPPAELALEVGQEGDRVRGEHIVGLHE